MVPGAFHQPAVYNMVAHFLHAAGYSRTYAIDLPSVGALATRDWDIQSVRSILAKELAADHNVLLVGNSYGGTVIAEAVKGYKTFQAHSSRHNRGRILALVFIAGFLPYIQDVEHPESKPDIRTISPKLFRYAPDGKVWADGDPDLPSQKAFYNDLPSEVKKDYWTSQLQFSSFDALAANATYIPYTGDFRCIYLAGLHDNTIPPPFARTFLEQPGAKFEVEWQEWDHVPMLSHAEYVAQAIRRAAGDNKF